MKRIAVVLAIALLAGCAPTQTMTNEQAGEYYLDTVCPTNALANAFNEAWNGRDAAFDDIVSAAGANADGNRVAIARLTDTSVQWPDSVASDIPPIRHGYATETKTLDEIAKAASIASMSGIEFTPDPQSTDAIAHLRDTLNLPTCDERK
jgi:uncharacterized protein YceK